MENKAAEKKIYMYVSCWNEHEGAPGLHVFRYEEETAALTHLEEINGKDSLNFSLVRGDRLYICNEITGYSGNPVHSGRIQVYRLDPGTGSAVMLAEVPTQCPNPSYISITEDGKYLMVAHHSTPDFYIRRERDAAGVLIDRVYSPEAALQLYLLDENGIPSELVDDIDHHRYTDPHLEAHPHSCVLSPSGDLVAVADKGTGRLYMYGIDRTENRFVLLDQALTDVPGAHPRYVVFHPDKPFLFVNHEASIDGRMYVTAFRYDKEGRLARICVRDAAFGQMHKHPDIRFEQQGFVISPDGRQLFTELNSACILAIFDIDQENGEITLRQNVSIDGVWPRGLALSPDARYVFTTCLRTGEITSYERQPDGTVGDGTVRAKLHGASYISFYCPGPDRSAE